LVHTFWQKIDEGMLSPTFFQWNKDKHIILGNQCQENPVLN